MEKTWQLEVFKKAFKKNLKLRHLLFFMKEIGRDEMCLDICHGDNTGGLSYYFRKHGGRWVTADLEGKNPPVMKQLLKERVLTLDSASIAFKSGIFDRIVIIDVLEHLTEEKDFLCEIHRILKSRGTIYVTCPNQHKELLGNKIRYMLGMRPERYGHVRPGYTLSELQNVVEKAGFKVTEKGSYSKFFTEMIELAINYGYIFRLKKGIEGTAIAPTSQKDLTTYGMAYKLFSLVHPFLLLLSKLDGLLFLGKDYCVTVVAKKRR